jgi:hypothetical protein
MNSVTYLRRLRSQLTGATNVPASRYEITAELPNGDWVWTTCVVDPANTPPPGHPARRLSTVVKDYHDMLAFAIDFAFGRGGRVHHIEKLSAAGGHAPPPNPPGWDFV